MIVCPLSVCWNWETEFQNWLKYCSTNCKIPTYNLSKLKSGDRASVIEQWFNGGGVMILGYEIFRILMQSNENIYPTYLAAPGADVIICDEGHLLKNNKTSLSYVFGEIRTMRRILLTGTPLQNHLSEYYCMVNFVKPYLLGTQKEFNNRFVNPIANGQYKTSSSRDILTMKRRSYVLHKLLDGCVQRLDETILKSYLPQKTEIDLYIHLSPLQKELYMVGYFEFIRDALLLNLYTNDIFS